MHKRAVVERDTPLIANLPTPMLENNNEWCWHGFTINVRRERRSGRGAWRSGEEGEPLKGHRCRRQWVGAEEEKGRSPVGPNDSLLHTVPRPWPGRWHPHTWLVERWWLLLLLLPRLPHAAVSNPAAFAAPPPPAHTQDYLHDPRLQPNPNAVLGTYTTNTYMLM